MLKLAKIRWSQSIIDCLILDMSEAGLRVSTETPIALPLTVTLEFKNGSLWDADVRWQRGNETGLALRSFTGLNTQAALEAMGIYTRMKNSGVHQLLTQLGDWQHFGSPELQASAEAVKRSIDRMEACLSQMAKS